MNRNNLFKIRNTLLTLSTPLVTLTKLITVITVLLVGMQVSANAATKPAEKQFLTDVQAAFDAKDVNKFLALVCWDEVTPSLKEELKAQFSMIVTQPVANIELLAPDTTKKQEYEGGGVHYRPNLTVIKNLKINMKVNDPSFKLGDPKAAYSLSMPVGEKEGKLMFTSSVETKAESKPKTK